MGKWLIFVVVFLTEAMLVSAPTVARAQAPSPPAATTHMLEVSAPAGAPTSYVCVGTRVENIVLANSNPETSGCDTIGADYARTQSNPDHVSDVHGAPSEFVLVRMLSGSTLVPPASTGAVQQVVVSAGTVQITRVGTPSLPHLTTPAAGRSRNGRSHIQ
jgi:hypothetical protein